MKKHTVAPLLPETYLAVIRGAPGSGMFRHAYALVDGKKKDITRNGVLSCAFFPAFVLKYFGLIKEPHVTVSGLVRDLKASGWKKIKRPKPGCILLWNAMDDARSQAYSYGHRHAGFYVGNHRAVSNLSSRGMPGRHHWTFGVKNGKPVRRIEAMYWHKKLEK